jgi:predicted RNA-binding protein Jag
MKSIKMKGKNVNEATEAALAVLGINKENASIRVINEGKAGMMGILGVEEAEVEVVAKEGAAEEAKQTLQNILDKMGFLAIAEMDSQDAEGVRLSVKG